MIKSALKALPGANAPRSGASLPTVIMVVALMMTLAFTVVAIAFNHLNLTFRSANNTKAKYLAEATLALAIEKARLGVENFGINQDRTITLALDAYSADSVGYLSFDEDEARRLGVPRSTNNRSDKPVQAATGQSIPGESLHLIARAEVNGAFSTMEAMISIPKFPYSIASGGAIRSNGGLLVAAVRPDVVYDLSQELKKEDLQPGHVVTNSELGDDALVLEGDNTIMGDVQSVSGATIKKGSKVFGETRLYAANVELPDLNATDYDPFGKGGGTKGGSEVPIDPDDIQMVNSDSAGTLSVKGYNVFRQGRADGTANPNATLTVDNGINLQGGVLYVNGNLNVNSGGVRGKGAIVATGSITINGGGEATTDNQAALVANGDISLRGNASEKAKFAGLIYTKGNLNSENLRLAGVFVAGGNESQVELKNTELYQVEELARLELSGRRSLELPNLVPGSYSLNGQAIEASYDFSVLDANLNSFYNPNSGSGEPPYLFKFKDGDNYRRFVNGPNGPEMVATSGPDQYVLDGADLGLKIFGISVKSSEEAASVIIQRFEQIYAAEGRTLTAQERTTLAGYASTLFSASQAGYNFSRETAQQAFESGDGGNSGAGEDNPMKWSIDMSQVFGTSKPMQVVSWKRSR